MMSIVPVMVDVPYKTPFFRIYIEISHGENSHHGNGEPVIKHLVPRHWCNQPAHALIPAQHTFYFPPWGLMSRLSWDTRRPCLEPATCHLKVQGHEHLVELLLFGKREMGAGGQTFAPIFPQTACLTSIPSENIVLFLGLSNQCAQWQLASSCLLVSAPPP